MGDGFGWATYTYATVLYKPRSGWGSFFFLFKKVIMKDKWMNLGCEDEELKPYVEPEQDFKEPKRIGRCLNIINVNENKKKKPPPNSFPAGFSVPSHGNIGRYGLQQRRNRGKFVAGQIRRHIRHLSVAGKEIERRKRPCIYYTYSRAHYMSEFSRVAGKRRFPVR